VRRFLSLLQSRWAAPIFLMPFLMMLAVHHRLGLSDALLAADAPGKRPARGYNLLLGINMYISVVFALVHLLDGSQRRIPWITARLVVPTILFLFGFLTL
jgi:hypothetical protein